MEIVDLTITRSDFSNCGFSKTWKTRLLENTLKWVYDPSNTPYLDHYSGAYILYPFPLESPLSEVNQMTEVPGNSVSGFFENGKPSEMCFTETHFLGFGWTPVANFWKFGHGITPGRGWFSRRISWECGYGSTKNSLIVFLCDPINF